MSGNSNFKNPDSGMDKYGKQRLDLGVLLRDTVLKQLDIPWTIENGTLLGAWRNGKFILHDDDFDFAMFFECDPIPLLPELLKKIKQRLPPQYDARIVSTYAHKIEVFDPSYGIYNLGPSYGDASFHYVTADLQCYQRCGDIYKQLYYNITHKSFTVHHEDMFPIGSIVLEGESFQAPCNVESILKTLYGSISPNAKYNPKKGLYEDEDEAKRDE